MAGPVSKTLFGGGRDADEYDLMPSSVYLFGGLGLVLYAALEGPDTPETEESDAPPSADVGDFDPRANRADMLNGE